MPITIHHALTATTPDNTTAEIRPQAHWNAPHVVSVSLAGNEVIKYIGAMGDSQSSGTVVFGNNAAVSFGMAGGIITATHNGITSQSAQTQGIQSIAAGGNTATGGMVQFSNANGLSFGLNNGTLTASVAAVPGQSNQAIGIYGSSQTTGQSSSSSVDARSLTVVGAGGVSVGMSAGALIISGATGGGAGDGINRIAAGTQTAGTNTTVMFANSNGISFGMSANNQVTASHNGLTSQSAQVLSAANGSSNFQTLNFADSNGVSWSVSNGSIVASVAAGGGANSLTGYAQGNTAGDASSATMALSSVRFRGAGIASVGYSGDGAVIISVPAGGGGGDGANFLAAGSQTATTLGTVAFVNSNGITFGMSGSTQITASHNGLTTAAVSNHTHGAGSLALTNVSGTISSTSNGWTISLSAAAGGGGANTLSVYAQSNTTQGSSGTIPATSLQFAGAGIASVGVSNGSVVISVPSGGGVGDGGNVIIAGTQTATSLGSVSFANSNGISFGLSGSTQLTASHNGLTSQSNQAASAANGSFAFQTLSFSNLNGISFGTTAGSAITASHNGLTTAAASNHSHGNPTLALTNISGTTASASNGLTLSLSANAPGAASLTVSAVGNTTVGSSGTWPNAVSVRGYGIVSVGVSNGSLLLSTPDAVDYTQLSVGFSTGGNTAGNTGLATGQVVFAGGANITLSGSTNGNSMTVSVVGGAGGGGGVGISGGTQSVSTGTMVFSNSNNLSFGMSGSSRMTMSAGVNFYAAGNTTQNSSTVLGIGSVPFNGLGAMTVGFSGGSVQLSAPATSSLSATGAVSISVNGSTVSIGVPNLSIYASSQTTGQSSSSSVALGALSVRGAGGVSVGMSAGELIISGGAGGGGGAGLSAGTQSVSTGTVVFSNSNNMSFGLSGSSRMTASYAFNVSAGTTSGNVNAVTFSNSNGVSFGLNAGVVTASVGAGGAAGSISAGTTSVALGQVVFSNSNGVSFGLNGSTITASAAGGGGTLTVFAVGNTTQASSGTINVTSVPINGLGAMTVGYSNGSMQFSAPATSSLSATGAVSISVNGSTISIGAPVDVTASFYEPHPAFDLTMQSHGQNSLLFMPVRADVPVSFNAIGMMISLSGNSSASASHGVSNTISYGLYSVGTGASSTQIGSMGTSSMLIAVSVNSNVSVGYTVSQGTNSTTYSSAGSTMTAMNGVKSMSLPFASSLAPGIAYFVAFANSTASVGGANALSCSFGVNTEGVSVGVGVLGPSSWVASNNTINVPRVIRAYSATSGAWPATIGLSQFVNYSNRRHYVWFRT